MLNIKYVADLETTTDPNDCRVWAYSCVEVGKDDVKYGTTLDGLLDFLFYEDCTVYFHNLKFDSEFLFIWLYEHGYSCVESKVELEPYTFCTLISDKGQFYSVIIQGKRTRIRVLDSLKILPFKVEEIAKAFDLPMRKLEIDYDQYRPIGWQLTQAEIDYIKNDVIIVGKALEVLFGQGLTAITQGSNAMNDYKKIMGRKKFERAYPMPMIEVHDDLKYAYKGGFTYLNPKYAGKIVGEGLVLDKNSMYPWVMKTKLLPYGNFEFFVGEYKEDERYPLYIQRVRCQFELKPNRIPMIQLKNNSRFAPTEYVTDSGGDDIVLTLTNIDLKLFFDQYNVYNIEYISGWKFKATYGLFDEYIDKWYAVKEEAGRTGNKALRTLAKLMLNALYGKFGTSPHKRSKYPKYVDGAITYVNGQPKDEKSVYIPMAAFITSYAREECIRSAQSVYERWVYSDTDSLHLLGWDMPDGLDIDDNRLGAWKIESVFTKAKFIRAKTYIEDIVSEKRSEILKCTTGTEDERNEMRSIEADMNITCAGMPKACYEHVTFDNFEIGGEFSGKLRPKHVKGGQVLIPTPFKIRA